MEEKTGEKWQKRKKPRKIQERGKRNAEKKGKNGKK